MLHNTTKREESYFPSFTELASQYDPLKDYNILIKPVRSSYAIIAPHGGKIEFGTSEIATLVASNEFSLGIFEGIRRNDNWKLHLESHQFDEPKILKLAQHSKIVITIHGIGTHDGIIFLGGRHQGLKKAITRSLKRSGFTVHLDGPDSIMGKNPDNICNQGIRGAGIQIEIPRNLREKEMHEPLATAIREGINDFRNKIKKNRSRNKVLRKR